MELDLDVLAGNNHPGILADRLRAEPRDRGDLLRLLEEAAVPGHASVAAVLLDADPDGRDLLPEDAATAAVLRLAAAEDSAELLRVLLGRGWGAKRAEALQEAANGRCYLALEVLSDGREAGPRPLPEDDHTRAVVRLAWQGAHARLREVLAARPVGRAVLNSALHRAARYGHREACAAVLDAGADANFEDPADQTTPLAEAAMNGRPSVLAELLARNADRDKPCLGKTALEWAARWPECAELLRR